MSDEADVMIEGLRQGLRDRIGKLFEIMSSPTVGDDGAEHFRASVDQCFKRYQQARKIISECGTESC